MGRSNFFHPQSLIIHGQSLLLLILVFGNKSIHAFHCRGLPCSPPPGTKPPSLAAHKKQGGKSAGNLARNYEKGRNKGFWGTISFTTSTVSFILSRSKVFQVSCIKRKPTRRNIIFFFFFFYLEWRIFLNLATHSIFILLQT